MGRRVLVIGFAVTAGVMASSCDSTARDTLVNIYNDESESVTDPAGTAGGEDSNDDASDDSPSIGQLAVDAFDEGSDAACATDKRIVENALETHFAFNGFDATTLDELAVFGVDDEANRWTLQISADSTDQIPQVAPIAGGPCDN